MAQKRKQYPSQARLRELFDYDPEGFLVWKSRGKDGDRAGVYRLDGDSLNYIYRINIKDREYEGGRLVWIWHRGDIPEGMNVHRRDWSGTCRIENLYCCFWKDRILRPQISNPSGKYKGVWKNDKWSKSWSCADLNGNEWYFSTEIAAATHYDNVCEERHGDRPNNTERCDVIKLRVTKSVARYMQTSQKSLEERAVVGVYEKRKKFAARFRKKNLGTYPTKEQAARAYNKAAYEHYGEHAVLNDIPDPLGLAEPEEGDAF